MQHDPKKAFRLLIERLMPGYPALLGNRYGVDPLLAEAKDVLDLAFVAANFRYTHIITQEYFRAGLSGWPPPADWLGVAAVAPSQVGEVPPGTHAGGSASAPGSGGAVGSTDPWPAPLATSAAVSPHVAVSMASRWAEDTTM